MPSSEDFARFSITNDLESDESDESDTEEPGEIDGVGNMGQVLLAEAFEEVGEGDDDDGQAQLSALGSAVWHTPVSMLLVILVPSG